MGAGAGKVLVVSGPSGVGKTTVCRRLLASGRFALSISATTRRPRGQEQDGVDYHFLAVPEFERRRDQGEFLEWARVHETTFYGTPRRPVLEALDEGKHVILNIDVQGAAQLRRAGLPLVTTFLLPPSFETLRERIELRRDTAPAEVERRLRVARDEIARSHQYDLRLVNDEVERVVGLILGHLDGGPPPADEGPRLGLPPRVVIGDVLVRPIEPRDDAAVAAIVRDVMTEHGADGPGFAIHDPEVAAMSAAYRGPGAAYLVLERDGEVLGGGGFAPLVGGAHVTCELRKMYFRPPLRGGGYGRALLARLLEGARAAGYRRCYLETLETMGRARRLYEAAGFRALCEPEGATGHTGCDAWYAMDL